MIEYNFKLTNKYIRDPKNCIFDKFWILFELWDTALKTSLQFIKKNIIFICPNVFVMQALDKIIKKYMKLTR